MSCLSILGVPLVVLALGPFPAPAQGVVEYGAATAGKTAGAGAKKMGDALGKIFEKSGDTLKNTERSSTRGNPATAAPQRKAGAGRSATADLQAAGGVTPTPEAFETLQAGAPAEEVLARLGPPAFRVVIPEEGRLVEIYHYSVKGRELGNVRVVDGKVAEIRPAKQ